MDSGVPLRGSFALQRAVWYDVTMDTQMKKPRDLAAILKPQHESKWVAIDLSYSHIIAAADTLNALCKLTRDPDIVIYHRVLPHDVTFAPAIF